jgi:hypothetical protein
MLASLEWTAALEMEAATRMDAAAGSGLAALVGGKWGIPLTTGVEFRIELNR